ncbi:MAG: COQ9 family protein [Alphaproteobacteria bacterium]|nr:COQ9 family protein [Alphaproteobacteria bacterium]OJV15839.1 MAG: hypothetical protein BGO27_08000 [Alphaproteobacteria bacterium 33-17]
MQVNLSFLRKSIVNQLVNHIPFDGWTDVSLKAAYSDANIDYALNDVIFPKGFVSIMQELINIINADFIEKLNQAEFHNMGIRHKIAHVIIKKLEAAQPYKEILETGSSMLLIKDRKLLLKQIWKESDETWRIIGDKALDFNYYSKRSLLYIVYTKTILFWFKDKSLNNSDTIAYMYKELDNTVKFGQMLGKFKDFGKIVTKLPFIRLLFIK